MKAVYPAVFTWNDDDKVFYVQFPDMENVFTDGADLYEALENAEDALNLMLCNYEAEHGGKRPPIPSDIAALSVKAGEIVCLVRADTQAYEAEITRLKWENIYRNCGRKVS